MSTLAGSKLEAAILAGPDALNKYISSGELEELADVMPFEDTNSPTRSGGRNSPSDRSKSPVRRKKSRFDTVQDHNAQMIYSKDVDSRQQIQPQVQASQQGFIPPLLALNVPQPDGFPGGVPPQSKDQDFRTFNNNNFSNSGDSIRPSPWSDGPPNQQQNALPNFPAGAHSGDGPNMGGNATQNPFSNNQNNSLGNSNFNNNSFHGGTAPFDGPYNNNTSNFESNGNGPNAGNYNNNNDNGSRGRSHGRHNDGGSRNNDNYNRNDSRSRDGGRRNDRSRQQNRRNRNRF